MIIEKIVVNNFMSYYGKSELLPRKGLNFVIGPGGSGKTNLWNAISFAVSGRPPERFDPLSKMLNERHRKETSNPQCSVEVLFEHEGKPLRASCSVEIEKREVNQVHKVSSEIDEFETPAYVSLYCDAEGMDELYREHKEDWSSAKRWANLMKKTIARNSENKILSVIVDGAFEYLSPDYREEVLTFADEKLEQIIIMMKTDDLQNRPCMMKSWVHRIKYDPQNLSSRIA